MQYATWLQDQPMLTKVAAVNLTSQEAKYHGVCRVHTKVRQNQH